MDQDTAKKLDECSDLIDRLQKSTQKSAALEVQVTLEIIRRVIITLLS
jgi:hypothetical protein